MYEKAKDPERELTKDHLCPTSRGGVDFIWNIVPACFRCNRMKNNMTVEEFRAARPGLVQRGPGNSTDKDVIGSVPQPAGSDFSTQAVRHLARTHQMQQTDSPEYWQCRRETLKKQADSMRRRFLEFAGQMTLPLDSSAKKAVQNAGEATELIVRKGLKLA